MNELQSPIDMLKSSVNIAVVGLSRFPGKAAHDIPLLMQNRGYNLVGVNPNATPNVGGVVVVPRLLDVELDIDIVNVFRPSSDADAIVDAAIERHDLVGDVRCVWLQEGITSEFGRQKCTEAGIEYFEDTCIYVVYQYLRI